jgi:hypothetical protein
VMVRDNKGGRHCQQRRAIFLPCTNVWR